MIQSGIKITVKGKGLISLNWRFLAFQTAAMLCSQLQ